MRIVLDPSITRVCIIAILIFIYAFTGTSGVMSTLQERMPEPHEWLYFVLFALGADAVYLLTFLGATPPEKPEG